MLSKAGGPTTFQRVLPKVTDLPSPLDAVGDETFIIRETEEVYRLDPSTRTWQVVGTLKRVGGKKPAEISEHLDSKANPHAVSLEQAYAHGSKIRLAPEKGALVIEAPEGGLDHLVHFLSNNGRYLRFGPSVGNSTAALWINGGRSGRHEAILRVVDESGADQFLLDSGGSVCAAGAATFKGGVKGPTTFQDTITARGGVISEDTLKLGGKKVAILTDKGKIFLTDRGLGVGVEPTEALDIAGNIRLSGTVSADLNPGDHLKFGLGQPKRRWKSMHAGALDLAAGPGETPLVIKAAADQKAPLAVIGDLVLDSAGRLGIGTDTPMAKLDVRGDIALGTSVNGARTTITDRNDGNITIAYNATADGKAVDGQQASWAVWLPGPNRSSFGLGYSHIGGSWRHLFTVSPNGTIIAGELHVAERVLATRIDLNSLRSAQSGSAIDLLSSKIIYQGGSHEFSGALSVDTRDASSSPLRVCLGGAVVFDFRSDGSLVPGRSDQLLGSDKHRWYAGFFADALHVGATIFADGVIKAPDGLEIETGSGVFGFESALFFKGEKSTIRPSRTTEALEVLGAEGTDIVLHTNKSLYGIHFSKGAAQLSGIGQIFVDNTKRSRNTPMLSLEQTWAQPNETFDAITVAITDNGSAKDSTLANFIVNDDDVLTLFKDELRVNVPLTVQGMSHRTLEGVVDLTDRQAVETPFNIPAGVRVEAVVVKVLGKIDGPRFWQVGDRTTPDRFASATGAMVVGSVVKGLNHCDRGQSVQTVEAPIVVTCDAPAKSGKMLVQVHFVSPDLV